ncbi:hypothetical protein [Anaerostipes sp.]|uniref:hypothetical protein n=1 Tax=Anaerostipes sp. TaxID=1872530 RepID=UPI0025BDB921|nr:hypothetical protein [Anaerostipes sp.]MBS7009107.1 hypothetical protein [Anaerostipes sp.]
MKKDTQKKFSYWDLDYKGKFKRTLWMLPLVIIFCILSPFLAQYSILPIWFPALLIVIFIAQAVYTYAMWKKEEKESDPPSQKSE